MTDETGSTEDQIAALKVEIAEREQRLRSLEEQRQAEELAVRDKLTPREKEIAELKGRIARHRYPSPVDTARLFELEAEQGVKEAEPEKGEPSETEELSYVEEFERREEEATKKKILHQYYITYGLFPSAGYEVRFNIYIWLPTTPDKRFANYLIRRSLAAIGYYGLASDNTFPPEKGLLFREDGGIEEDAEAWFWEVGEQIPPMELDLNRVRVDIVRTPDVFEHPEPMPARTRLIELPDWAESKKVKP
jgi:hypothetical protein